MGENELENMNGHVDSEQSVRELILRALDGDATDVELDRLNDMLRTSERLQASTARFLCDEAMLGEEIGTISKAARYLHELLPSEEGVPRVGESVGVCPPRTSGQSAPHLRPTQRPGILHFARNAFHFVDHHGWIVAAAATVLGIVFSWQYLSLMEKFDTLYSLAAIPDPVERDQLRSESRATGRNPGIASVARVTGISECEWPAGEQVLAFGDELAPGQRLKLTKGVVQLTLNTGARVVVEGPVDFVASTPSESTLTSGRLAAAVPRFARGYTILTPTAEVVDLGTEFGVDVDESGASEVHVFDGDVVARPRGNGVADGELIHARIDEAIQFDATVTTGRRINADSRRFVRRLTPDLEVDQLPPLPVTTDLALWLAADVMPGVELEADAPISLWPDLMVGDNRFPDDACQFDSRICPTWIRDAEDLPAVRFDGWSSYMATSPMATGERQTLFVVCAPSPTSFAGKTHGGMLLKYGLNAPSLELTLLRDRTPRAWVWAKNDGGSAKNVGVLTGQAVEPHFPCAIAYTYDADADRAELFLNGESQGIATAPSSIEQNAKRYIGSHAQPWYEAYFLGNIYEIITYDSSLESADRDQVFRYLSVRYGFPLGDAPIDR
jgi:hypothetical protein